MQDLKNKIEAVLFITARAMSIEEIAQFCNIGSIGTIKEAMKALRKDYETRVGSLEIIEEEGKYRLNIQKQYNYLSMKLLSAAELDAPTQATLALIAYKQPVKQAEIIKMRGNTAYDHIHSLKDMEFIVSEKSGRTRTLKLAPKFFEYFDVVQEALQKRLEETMEKQEKLSEDVQDKISNEEKILQREEEKKEYPIPIIKEKKKKKIESQEIAVALNKHLEIEIMPKEVILSLDADDFGSKC
ncbi:MAG: SMC-Scp complex subunit ScpB [bacterium]|nr:SMC-Scp complex subunit ScpB [bacterium]